ncbi:MAG: molybdopterin cofactor-binding domain-containing protein [Woeseia sp.]
MAAVGGGLLVSFRLSPATASPAAADLLAPNAFVRIDRAGRVILILPYVEMGQGAYTSQTQLLAEELEVDLDQVTLAAAPPDESLYSHPVFGDQITGGSAGLRGSWDTLRLAGATARVMLETAAAQRWGVECSECAARRGEVVHEASGRRATYGALVDDAARLPVPLDIMLKDPASYKLIGRSVKRVDTPEKVTGAAKFGIDALPAGVKFAAVAACPVFGGKLGTVDERPALRVRGVRQVVKLDDAVAVVADHTWAARKGLAALDISWNEGNNATLDTARLVADCDAALEREGVVAAERGDPEAAEAQAASRYEAVFRMPMLAHLAMEPINCTAHVREDGCEIWVGCQRLALARRLAAEALGIPLEKVTIHNHLLGGGFGRRLEADYVAQAVRIAHQVEGPVKVTWSREEDVQHDYYRFHNHSRVRVGIDAQQRPVSFSHRIVGPSVMARWLPIFFQNGVDLDMVGGATGPYRWPAQRIEYVRQEAPPGLATGNWRGVGPTRNVFVVESVIDDLARAAGRDPLEYRRSLLADSPRALAVLERAADLAGWGRPLPRGRGRGISLLNDFGSYVAEVAEVSVEPSGSLRVERVVCVVDCGVAVNPDVVHAQMEGGIIFGLSAALYGKITVANGRVEQSNFDDCPVLRMNETPSIEVHIVDSAEEPGGVGEPGTAALFPAVTNAIYAATGVRLYELPIDRARLRSA